MSKEMNSEWVSVNDYLPPDDCPVIIEFWGGCIDKALFEKERDGLRNVFTVRAYAFDTHKCFECGYVELIPTDKPYRKIVNPDWWKLDANDNEEPA